MSLNDRHWRPITFQGETFPPSFMAISVLMSLNLTDEELGEWLWRLPICCGVTKRAPADRCAQCAQRAVDLMLERRQEVLDEIRERLGPHGFDAETTYRDWIVALQRIVELSKVASGECEWSAPMHPDDPYKTKEDALRFMQALDRERARLMNERRPD